MFVTELKGGTLTSSAAGFAWCLVRPHLWGVERDRVGWVVVGTLLGPEGTGRSCCGVGLGTLEGFMLVVPLTVVGLAVGDVERLSVL